MPSATVNHLSRAWPLANRPVTLVRFPPGGVELSVTNTVLIFVGIPALIVLVIAGLGMAGGGRGAPRYRPGRPFEFTPVWFLSSPDQVSAGAEAVALPSGGQRRELTGGPENEGTPVAARGTGGASDRW